MTFTPHMAERRFGYGLAPHVAAPRTPAQMLDTVAGADVGQTAFPIPDFAYLRSLMVEKRKLDKRGKALRGTPEAQAISKQTKLLNRRLRGERAQWFAQTQLRRIHGHQNFRERLVAFWGDHFTALGKRGLLRRGTSPYLEDAVRPHINGRFVDMLVACVSHPLMLHYLDQENSVGPNSPWGLDQSRRRRGMNENLAREVLELHTLGVGGPYDQTDVRQLAELFTGMGYKRETGFRFRKKMAEPGAETVLGKTYGPKPTMQPIREVLNDLAAHPATAAHLARKLAVHFVGDEPDSDLIRALTDAYLDNDGALMPVYETLLAHPASWRTTQMNIRPPAEFVSTALRALAVPPQAFAPLGEREISDLFYKPMALMGQVWQKPGGPDGWPEEDSAWITPQGIAARLEWAVHAPARLLDALPDPRDFVSVALGPTVPTRVRFAAKAAESRAEAIGLILASPAIQRR